MPVNLCRTRTCAQAIGLLEKGRHRVSGTHFVPLKIDRVLLLPVRGAELGQFRVRQLSAPIDK